MTLQKKGLKVIYEKRFKYEEVAFNLCSILNFAKLLTFEIYYYSQPSYNAASAHGVKKLGFNYTNLAN